MTDTSIFEALWDEANAQMDADGGGFSPDAVLLLRQALAIAEDDYARAADVQGDEDEEEGTDRLNAQNRLAGILHMASWQLWLSDSKDDQDEAIALRIRAADLYSALAEELTHAQSHYDAYRNLKWVRRRLLKRAFLGQWRLFGDAWRYMRRDASHFSRMTRILLDHGWSYAEIKAAGTGKIPVPVLFPIDICECEYCADQKGESED